MKKKSCKKIPAEKEKELLRIYKCLKLHDKEVKAILNNDAVRKLKKTLKNLDELAELKVLTRSQEIKGNVLDNFFQDLRKMAIYKDFDSVKRGAPKKDFALDVLIYLLAQEYGDDYNSIDDFLNENINLVLGEEAIRKRLERIKKAELIRNYNKFVSLAKTVKIIEPGPDPTAHIAVYFNLPFLK